MQRIQRCSSCDHKLVVLRAKAACQSPIETLGNDAAFMKRGIINISRRRNRSERVDVFSLGLAGLAILAEFVADLLAITQSRAISDSRDVHEHVRAAIFRRDKAKALVLIEKLHSAGRHQRSLFISGQLPHHFISRTRQECLAYRYHAARRLIVTYPELGAQVNLMKARSSKIRSS